MEAVLRVLLINPHRMLRHPESQYISPPQGLASLASFIRPHHEVGILDCPIDEFHNRIKRPNGVYQCGTSYRNLLQKISDFNPDVVGISCIFTARFPSVVYIATLVKLINANIKVVVGGIHATMCAEEVLHCPFIDYVVMGEAELPFLQLLDSNFTQFRAVSFQGRISTERWLLDDLDIFPAYDLIDMEAYFNVGIGRDALSTENRWASVVTSRGCPLQCSFCSSQEFWSRKWRGKSAKQVVDEIEYLIKTYKVKEISFEDDNLTANYDRAEKIFQGILDRKLKVKWFPPNGVAVHHIDRPLVRLMKKSGCTRLQFGIESGDDYVLHQSMNKQVSLDKVREVINIVHSEGLITNGYFVFGMPGETRGSIMRSLEFAKSLPLDEIAMNIAVPFPGTPVEKTCKDNGWLIKDSRTLEAEDESGGIVFIETPLLSKEEVVELKRYFFKNFYNSRILRNPLRYAWRAIRKPSMIRRFLFKEKDPRAQA